MGQTGRPRNHAGLHVLIAGGGVAGLETMLALRELAGELVSLELLSPEHHFWYRPLSVAEPFDHSQTPRFELSTIAEAAGAVFTPGALIAVDADARVARTNHGTDLHYDVLVVACGTRTVPALDGALTFRGPSDTDRLSGLLGEIERREASRIVFVLPPGAGWSLPLYELALLTATHVEQHGIGGVELDLVTHEPSALSLFGPDASAAVSSLLWQRGVALHADRHVESFTNGWLQLDEETVLPADRVVALPRLEGIRIDGIHCDRDGFVDVDRFGRVEELADVYAVGDITTFPIKQGGVAAQKADVVAEAIAARAGASLETRHDELRAYAVLLTGREPLYLSADLATGGEATTPPASDPLFWPAAKIAARHLSPLLAGLESAKVGPVRR
jgi:sulfide:quinone oxidoreductase